MESQDITLMKSQTFVYTPRFLKQLKPEGFLLGLLDEELGSLTLNMLTMARIIYWTKMEFFFFKKKKTFIENLKH